MKRRAKLGDIEFTVIEDENPTDSVEITDNSVEDGQNVSDHVKQQASVISLQGYMTGDDASDKLRKLKTYMNKGEILTYVGRNLYSNMLIENIDRNHGVQIKNGFAFNITLKQIRISNAKEVEISFGGSKKTATKVKTQTNNGKQQAKNKTTTSTQKVKSTVKTYKEGGRK